MNPPIDPEHNAAHVDDATRQRLLALVKDELARVSAEALAGGVPPAALAKLIEDRIAELQRQQAATTRNAP